MLLLRLPLPWVHVCCLVGALVLSTVARGDAVLVRFLPSAGAATGYKVYWAPQTTGAIAGASMDVGAADVGAGGNASYWLAGLDPTLSYSVEMTAYDARGVESGRSNRLNVAPRVETLGAPLWQSNFGTYAPGVHVPGFADSRGDSRTTTGTDLFAIAYLGANDPAFGTAAASGMVASTYTGAESAAWGSYEISGRLWTSGDAGAGIAARVTRSDASRQYFTLHQNASVGWTIGARNEPALTCSAGTVPIPSLPSGWLWSAFRFRVTRAASLTRLRAKLWRFGGSEPAAWQADCWTTTAGAADAGAFALLREASGSVYFDDLALRPVIGKLDPIPPR